MLSFAAMPSSGVTGLDTSSPTDSLSVNKHTGPLSSNATAPAPSISLAPTGPGWSLVTSPNTSTTQYNVLEGVTCASAADCWAVGEYDGGSAQQPLIERWDGTSWSIVNSPNTSAPQKLQGVTCASATECWAVGGYYNDSVNQTLIHQWNGTAWAIVSSPNTSATQDNFLNGVTCASASECWAVGHYSSGSSSQTLIEQWNGTAWAIVSSPNTSASVDNYLYCATCASPSECWAVGYSYNGSFSKTLINEYSPTIPPLISVKEDSRQHTLRCRSTGRFAGDRMPQSRRHRHFWG
jgi:hypothetical protein